MQYRVLTFTFHLKSKCRTPSSRIQNACKETVRPMVAVFKEECAVIPS